MKHLLLDGLVNLKITNKEQSFTLKMKICPVLHLKKKLTYFLTYFSFYNVYYCKILKLLDHLDFGTKNNEK